MTSPNEAQQRYTNIRSAMEAAGVDAVLVCGSEYSGFEGAVRYVSGFRIVHRYAYVVIPPEGEPTAIFPSEARYVGDHGEGWLDDKVFEPHPGQWMAGRFAELGWKRIGVYGLEFVMPVRDYAALTQAGLELIPFDREFDMARAVKSEAEIDSVRESMAINEAGFWAVQQAYEPGRTQAEVMARAEAVFAERGTGRQTMDMVLWGPAGTSTPEFRIPDHTAPIAPEQLLLYSLEIAGPGGHWVEFSRPLCRAPVSADTQAMLDAYQEYFAAARETMKAGASAHSLHRAVSAPFTERGFVLGHVTGHSIGMTMIEFPRIGEGEDVELLENMVLSMHPHAITQDGASCLYMQDTWRVTADGGEPLSVVPLQVFDGSEAPTQVAGAV